MEVTFQVLCYLNDKRNGLVLVEFSKAGCQKTKVSLKTSRKLLGLTSNPNLGDLQQVDVPI